MENKLSFKTNTMCHCGNDFISKVYYIRYGRSNGVIGHGHEIEESLDYYFACIDCGLEYRESKKVKFQVSISNLGDQEWSLLKKYKEVHFSKNLKIDDIVPVRNNLKITDVILYCFKKDMRAFILKETKDQRASNVLDYMMSGKYCIVKTKSGSKITRWSSMETRMRKATKDEIDAVLKEYREKEKDGKVNSLLAHDVQSIDKGTYKIPCEVKSKPLPKGYQIAKVVIIPELGFMEFYVPKELLVF